MQLVFLDEFPQAIDSLAPASWAEWGVHDGLTLEQVRARLAACLHRGRLPIGLIARDGDQVLGSAGLDKDPVVGRNGLGPWLGALWVRPESRRRGYGALLIDAAARIAADLGIMELYAATSTADRLFRLAGWREVERLEPAP